MSPRAHGQIRRSQAIGTFGPGALIDLPRHSGIIGGLDGWPRQSELEEIEEPRLSAKLQAMTQVPMPKLYAPPADRSAPWEAGPGITAWRFPEWFIVQEAESEGDGEPSGAGARRLVHRRQLDRGRYEGQRVTPTRFVRACPKGHVADLDWFAFVHRGATDCLQRQLSLEERGTGGDLGDLWVRCACKASRQMSEATASETEGMPLGPCNGERPWLGRGSREECGIPARLLIRTATNAYFPQVVSVLSLPDRRTGIQAAVQKCADFLIIVRDVDTLRTAMQYPQVQTSLGAYSEEEILVAIQEHRSGVVADRRVKEVELEAILAAPFGYGEDVPGDEKFYARRLPDAVWRRGAVCEPIEAVIQLHRLREVAAVTGFTRFEALTPDIHGEYDSDVQPAQIATNPTWFPAVENRGEGVFVQLRSSAVTEWLKRPAVSARIDALAGGHQRWLATRTRLPRNQDHIGGVAVLIHTLSHLVLQSLSMTCGYPASSIRERIYVAKGQFGFLLYTGTPDADGTLGGLVQEGRHFARHLTEALRMASLCSNDPICAQHESGQSMEGRWLHGAACHGCSFIAETSCELRNDHLDRALVVPVLGKPDAAFFPAVT